MIKISRNIFSNSMGGGNSLYLSKYLTNKNPLYFYQSTKSQIAHHCKAFKTPKQFMFILKSFILYCFGDLCKSPRNDDSMRYTSSLQNSPSTSSLRGSVSKANTTKQSTNKIIDCFNFLQQSLNDKVCDLRLCLRVWL